jgi:hypothetical protein
LPSIRVQASIDANTMSALNRTASSCTRCQAPISTHFQFAIGTYGSWTISATCMRRRAPLSRKSWRGSHGAKPHFPYMNGLYWSTTAS